LIVLFYSWFPVHNSIVVRNDSNQKIEKLQLELLTYKSKIINKLNPKEEVIFDFYLSSWAGTEDSEYRIFTKDKNKITLLKNCYIYIDWMEKSQNHKILLQDRKVLKTDCSCFGNLCK
jgi:hypothetical protein